jgi:gluconate 2-dehydrogenase gamma chain
MGRTGKPTRRECLGWVRAGLGGAWLLQPEVVAALQHAHSAMTSGPAAPTYFDAATAEEVEALAAQIVPSDDGPGAREAGVIHFIDRALATFDRDKRELYKSGLAATHAARRRMFPESHSIAGLDADRQRSLVEAIEKTEFFEQLRFHTVVGMLAHPSWGGNRNGSGWRLIQFEDRHVFQPPFGYYDDPKNFGEER